MSFDLVKFLKVLELVAAPVLVASGVPPQLVPVVVHGIAVAQAATQPDGTPKSGAEKKAIALDAVTTGIAGINAVRPGAVDPGAVDVVSKGIDTTIGVINLVKSNGQKA